MARARKLFLGFLLATSLGCGGSPAVRFASHGDFPALGKELDERAKAGKLDDDAVRAVAKAVLTHDLARFSGDGGVQRTQALVGCAKPIESALHEASKGREADVAAAAAWVLVDAGVVGVDAFTDAHRDDPHPLWRAVAARGLVDANEAELRAARAADGDQHVRLAAVLAAGDAGCASDFPLLLESARKDPAIASRVAAVRGLSKLAPRLEGASPRADLVERLAELWDVGDEPLRGAIARAWAAPVLFDAGGRQQLSEALGREEGHVTVEAASSMLMAGVQDGALVLAKLAVEADQGVRAHALRLLDPSLAAHLEVLLKTLDEPKGGAPDDAHARLIAATSLFRVAAHRGRAEGVLLSLSKRTDRIGTEAAVVLADARDERVRPRLVSDLATPSALRFRVAAALVRLGHPEETRVLLASADPDVRDGAACSILGTPRP
jgi:hypothetical protein